MRILCLTTVLPAPRSGGGEVVSDMVLGELVRQGHVVRVLGWQRPGAAPPADPHCIAAGSRVIEAADAGARKVLWLVRALARGEPVTVAKFAGAAYRRTARSLIRDFRPDIVLVDHAQVGGVIDLDRLGVPIVTLAHNIEHGIAGERAARAGNAAFRWLYRREARLLRGIEVALVRRSQAVLALTRRDAAALAALDGDDRIHLLPLYSQWLDRPEGDAKPAPTPAYDIGLLGHWQWPENDAGLRWFFAEVHPKLPPGLSIAVAGKGAGWLQGRYPNVSHRGFVPDAGRFMAEARVFVVPTIAGGGVQIKTLEAIVAARRIVATPMALRGIDDPPAIITEAATPDAMAAAIAQACRAPPAGNDDVAARAWSLARREGFRATLSTVFAPQEVVAA